ncbi:MAG TPA: radical SAM protein, partial [Solibacterales bacterium]|nr:radical SAM protein [Bryobacterales bacterium]
ASWQAHFGEERPLVGRGGSGTIFFSRCNLLCEFCQNAEIAHAGEGRDVSAAELADMMLALQRRGCHNVNLVTPTHVVPSIVAALAIALRQGLRVPLVYNCGGYEPVEVLRLLDGIVDIYLADAKYMDAGAAARYSRGAKDYPEVCRSALIEMHRQVGNLVLDGDQIAVRGLIIRHLVLPGELAGTERFARWAAETLGPGTAVNVMAQYRPAHRAHRYPELNRRITGEEYRRAVLAVRQAGLTNLTGDC